MRYIYLQPVKTARDEKRAKKLPAMAPGEFAKLISDKTNTRVITESTQEASRESYLDFQKMIFKEVSELLKSNKHYLSDIIQESYQEKTSPPVFYDGKKSFILTNISSIATDLFFIKKIREDKTNDNILYKELYNEVRTGIKNAPRNIQTQFSKFKSRHSSVSQNLADRTRKLVDWSIIAFPHNVSIPTDDTYDPTNPGPEEGEGNKTDQFMDQDCSDSNPIPNPRGFLKNLWWPLKPHTTSVKNQGRRGTCPVFGTVAATESRISVQYNKMVNLSEQDLYKKQKLDWNPNIFDDYYDDGYFQPIGMLYQMANAYTFPFESAWEYNPSMSRLGDPNLRKYTHSCDNYSGICSDTNHQARRIETITEVKEAE